MFPWKTKNKQKFQLFYFQILNYLKLEGKIKVTIDPENEAKGRSKEIVYCLEHKHWGCKNPPVAILTSKLIKNMFQPGCYI